MNRNETEFFSSSEYLEINFFVPINFGRKWKMRNIFARLTKLWFNGDLDIHFFHGPEGFQWASKCGFDIGSTANFRYAQGHL